MRAAIMLLVLVAACDNAEKTAIEKLGNGVRCVSSSSDLAYCVIGGRAFICDTDDCVPAPSAPQTQLELDGDRERKEQDQINQTTIMSVP